MKNLIEKILEHLKTRKKYNRLQLLYDVKCEELEDKIIDLNEQIKINKLLKQKFKKELDDQIEETIKLKEKLKEIKRGSK